MAYAEALQYDGIWWLRFNETRQRTSFTPQPSLILVRPSYQREARR